MPCVQCCSSCDGYSIGDNLVVVHLGEQIDGKVHGVVCYIVVKGLIKVKVLRL